MEAITEETEEQLAEQARANEQKGSLKVQMGIELHVRFLLGSHDASHSGKCSSTINCP